jgi:hypothetical protein
LSGEPIKESGQRGLASDYFAMPPEADKRAAVELHKTGVSLKRIREYLNMSERGLRRVLAYARKNPEAPVKKKSKNAVRPSKLSLAQQAAGGDHQGGQHHPLLGENVYL